MFAPVSPTAMDLNFRIAGIPVTVSPWFWAAGCLLGLSALREGLPFLLAWLMVLFVSILVHELGHALTAKWFGYSPNIVLYHFGGVAMYAPHYRTYTVWKSILITLAGPAAGFALYGVLLLLIISGTLRIPATAPEQVQRLLMNVIGQLLFINLWWGILNLVPVMPLDGGQICRDICTIFSPHNGIWLAVKISIVVAGLVALYFYLNGVTFSAVMFAILCANNIQMLQQRNQF